MVTLVWELKGGRVSFVNNDIIYVAKRLKRSVDYINIRKFVHPFALDVL